MYIRKIFLPIIAFFSILLILTVKPIKSYAYYDAHNDFNIPKGGEFVHEQFIYRVVRPKTSSRFGLVEIAGLNPEYIDPTPKGHLGYICIAEEYDYHIVGIADYAFKDNKNIRGFQSVCRYFRYIGKGAFEGCTNIRYFGDKGKGMTTIKERAFYGCKSLKSIDFVHNRLNLVGKDAFKNTKKNFKVETWNMSKKHATKVKKMLKKAGAKKPKFKMHYFKERKDDFYHCY